MVVTHRHDHFTLKGFSWHANDKPSTDILHSPPGKQEADSVIIASQGDKGSGPPLEMEISLQKKVLVSLIVLLGMGFAGLAIFANWFGFDLENDWENGRVSTVVVSGLFILTAILILTAKYWLAMLAWIQKSVSKFIRNILGWSAIQNLIRKVQQKLNSWKTVWTRTLLAQQIGASRVVRYFSGSRDRQAALIAVLCSIGIIIVYIWYISMGLWTEWPTTTTYYNKLADAFLHNQVSLLLEPHPALSALSDPYDVENRQGFPYLWDAVFYNGKYFLYWGPTPALLLTAFRIFYSGEIGDQYLVFAFLCGVFLVSVLFLLKLRSKFFPNLDWRWVIPGIFMAGLANPLPWMLNRPAVYEAAVSGGQFFLILALYLGFTSAIDSYHTNYWNLACIGICLALSAASRMSLMPALIFLLLMIAWNIVQRKKLIAVKKILSLGALGIPFAAGMGGLGWYNLVRFGSFFEFGLRYQLTTKNQNALYDYLFSWANVPVNLYNYLVNPFQLSATFPYIKNYWVSHFIIYPINSPPYCYFAEPVSGLLLDAPYILLACIAFFFLLREGRKILDRITKKQGETLLSEDGLLQWMLFTLSGIAALAFVPILLYFTVTMRYLADVVPSLVLLATLGSWIGVSCFVNKPTSKKWFIVLVITLATLSVITGVLLAMSGMDNRLEKVNPALYYRLVELLSFK